jgi:transcriptional regulator with XRE-family HTH domain
MLLYTFFKMPRKPKSQLKPLRTDQSETIGERIARIRKGKGLTQAELSEKIGIASFLVSDYERGRIRLYDEMVARFAITLGVTTDEILGTLLNKKPQAQISLRLIKRIQSVEKLPEAKQKALLTTIDAYLKSNEIESE